MILREKQSGQSLLEVVVAVGVVVLLTTGLIAGTTASLRSGQRSRSKSQAANYLQDGMEYVRRDRDTSWATFFARNGQFCLDESGNFSSPPCSTNVAGVFTRSVMFSTNGNTKDVTVSLTWQEGSAQTTSQVVSSFTPWKTPAFVTATPSPSLTPTPLPTSTSTPTPTLLPTSTATPTPRPTDTPCLPDGFRCTTRTECCGGICSGVNMKVCSGGEGDPEL